MMKYLVCFMACWLLPCVAWARNTLGYTAETLSHESALIALATPLEVETFKGPGDVWFTRMRLRMDEVIKGAVSEADVVTIYCDHYDRNADPLGMEKMQKEEKRVLIFAKVARHHHAEVEGKYVLLTLSYGEKAAYAADTKVQNLYTPEFATLTEFTDLLKRTRKQVAEEKQFLNVYENGTIEVVHLEVPMGTDASYRLLSMGASFIRVPKYQKPKSAAPEDVPEAPTEE